MLEPIGTSGQFDLVGGGAAPAGTDPTRIRRRRRLLYAAGAAGLLYLAVAYVIMPLAWERDVRRHPELFDAPRITHTPDGIPGDPVNVALLGSESDLIRAMLAAKWDPADALTVRSSARIAMDSVFRRPDINAYRQAIAVLRRLSHDSGPTQRPHASTA